MYLLLDANVTAGYYLPRSLPSKLARDRISNIFDSVRSGAEDHFFYIPNFCVAEVFSVFMKHAFGSWNNHLRASGTIDKRVYNSLVTQFSERHSQRVVYLPLRTVTLSRFGNQFGSTNRSLLSVLSRQEEE